MEEVRAEGEDGTCKTEMRPLLHSTCGVSRDKHKGGGEHVVADCSKGRDVDAVVGGPDVTRTAAARLAPSHVPTSNAITFAVLVT
jgi:hypothetical protein